MELNILEGLKAIVDAKLSGEIRHMAVYDSQYVEREDEKKLPWNEPALFFEIMPYKTEPLGGRLQKADITIRLHLVTAYKGDARLNLADWQRPLGYLELKNKVFAAFEGMRYTKELDLGAGIFAPVNDAGEYVIFNSLTRRQVDSFSPGGKLKVYIQTFNTVAYDYSAIPLRTKPENPVILKPRA